MTFYRLHNQAINWFPLCSSIAKRIQGCQQHDALHAFNNWIVRFPRKWILQLNNCYQPLPHGSKTCLIETEIDNQRRIRSIPAMSTSYFSLETINSGVERPHPKGYSGLGVLYPKTLLATIFPLWCLKFRQQHNFCCEWRYLVYFLA